MTIRKGTRRTTAAVLLFAAALLGGCGQETAKPSHSAADVNKAQAGAGNAFAMRLAEPLLSEAAGQHRNAVFSPLSVSFALSLLLNGAAGETRDELLTLLAGQGMDAEAVNSSNEALMDVLQHGDPAVEFRLANALYAKKGLALESEYVKRMKEQYAAPVGEVDFGNAASAAKTVNDWAAKQTKNKIKELVDPAAMPSNIVMLLLDAVYFNGTWMLPFDEAATKDGTFHADGGRDVRTPMMAMKGEFLHKSSPAYQAVQLLYGSGGWSMFVILPAEGSTLKDAEAAVLQDAKAWTDGYEGGETELQLPRFKIEATYDLKPTLKALGMVRAMDPNLADFSGMIKEGKGGLFVSEVKHKAFIEVNEKGTEAAAVTEAAVSDTAAVDGEPFVFRADRPFMFAIRHNTTGTIAFLGSVADPAAGS